MILSIPLFYTNRFFATDKKVISQTPKECVFIANPIFSPMKNDRLAILHLIRYLA